MIRYAPRLVLSKAVDRSVDGGFQNCGKVAVHAFKIHVRQGIESLRIVNVVVGGQPVGEPFVVGPAQNIPGWSRHAEPAGELGVKRESNAAVSSLVGNNTHWSRLLRAAISSRYSACVSSSPV